MATFESFSNKLYDETMKQRCRVISKDTTLDEIKEFLKENALVDLLVNSLHWYNNLTLDKFLADLDFTKLQLEKINGETNSTALQLACFLAFPKTALKIIEFHPEQIGRFSNNDYTPLSTAILNCFIEEEMYPVVFKMFEHPEHCNLNAIQCFNKNIKCYVWQYLCNRGMEMFIRRMYSNCLSHFNIMNTTSTVTSPLIDLINHDLEDIVVDLIKNHREKCQLVNLYGNKTLLIVALLKNCKSVASEILTNYDDCNFKYINPNGITAFELLCAYGYQGVVFDILENRRDLYHGKFIHSKGQTPFTLALFQKNWDLAGSLVAYKYVDYEEIRDTRINGLTVNQYLVVNNEMDLLKFFMYVENKYNSDKSTNTTSPNNKIDVNDEGWIKIRELGLEEIVKDILKDPIAFTKSVQNGNTPMNLSINNPMASNTLTSEDFTGLKKLNRTRKPLNLGKIEELPPKPIEKPKITKKEIKPKKEPVILETIPAPKKRGRPRKTVEPNE